MKNKIKNYGFSSDIVQLEDKQYRAFGNSMLDNNIIQSDGDWTNYLPTYEPQFNTKYDTFGCTVFGSLNSIETLMKKIYGGDHNYSDRFVYILSKIRPPGGDPHKVADNIRKAGLINQEELPFTETFEEFIQPDPLTQELVDKALKFIDDKDIGHEWIFTNNPNKKDRIELLKHYLQRGTVCVSVTAWYEDNGVYKDLGQSNTHWCQLVRLDEIDGEVYPVIFDSYDFSIKKLHPDHHIEMAKRYSITPKKITDSQKKSWYQILADVLKKLLGIQKEVDKLKIEEKNMENEIKTPVETPKLTQVESFTTKYKWDSPEEARHSVRVICDEEKLTIKDKNDLCATVGAESGWKPRQKSLKPNFDGTHDHGIIQLNEKYWIGKNKLYPNIEAVYNDPEGCIRWMCQQWKAGNKNWWYAYKNGSYKKYFNPKFDKDGKLI